jgi:hypothetical protein
MCIIVLLFNKSSVDVFVVKLEMQSLKNISI